MAQLTQMTNEQLHALIEAVRAAAVGAAGSAAAAAAEGADPTKGKGSFSTCTHSFGGARDHDVVEEFLANITLYKELEGISDENALKGISLLFYGMASTWWQGVRKEAVTWKDAIDLIRDHFSPTKPAYQVYMEFFQNKQDDHVPIDTFVIQKRALLAQLPSGRHDEDTELDLLFGLLNIKYRKHITRQSIRTFKDLLEQGRIIEHNNQEDQELVAASKNTRGSKRTTRCTYCSFRGHTFDNCRKRQKDRHEEQQEE
ncbi:activity-regulated cytoskeleton associated protein 1 [Drosophila santomea]|uniref:activity-regulated cytoskeleton associated protein 1 n=1 Tax=Drosophila santomea TaxID=129105 RepID=UPI001952E70E|nr:activity-regulated cytoskeleton associated protein 1 [Drosophila santomea]